MLIRGWRPLKYNWSSLLDCTDELLVPQQGQNVQVRKRARVNVSVRKHEKLIIDAVFSGAGVGGGGH